MQNGIAALHCLFDSVWISNVSGEYFKFVFDIGRAGIQPSPRTEGVVQDEGPYIVACANECFCEMRTDEPVRTR
jgi:hypothetical protein